MARIRNSGPLLAIAVLPLVLGACSSPPESYMAERGMDLLDVLDVKYGCTMESMGVGFKGEASNYFGAGIGIGSYEDVTEQFGRHATQGPHSALHLAIYGMDGPILTPGVVNGDHEYATTGLNCCQKRRPPWMGRFRVGGELYLLSANMGAYLNLAELGDFLVGWTTVDYASDDDVAYNTLLVTGE